MLVFAPLAQAQRAGVINDPDGFVNLRAEKNAHAAVIATVKTGESFTFKCENDADWCKVTLTSGKSGWMHLSRIRLHFTEKDLPTNEKDPAGESGDRPIRKLARVRIYAGVTRRAARGDAKALKQFFSLAQRCRWCCGGEYLGRSYCWSIIFWATKSSQNSCSLSRCRIG